MLHASVFCLVLLLVARGAVSGAPEPAMVQFGMLMPGSGIFRHVSCDVGGYRTLFHNANEEWEETGGTCPEPACSEFSPAVSGLHKVTKHGRLEGDNATVGCQDGYSGHPKPQLTFTCKRRLKRNCNRTILQPCIHFFWKSLTREAGQKVKVITCKADGNYCPAPRAQDQWLLEKPERLANVYEPGEFVQLTCKPGFQLKVPTADAYYVTCRNGMWNRAFPPCIEVRCSLPQVAHMLPSREQYQYGEWTTLSCEPNYFMIPSRGNCKCGATRWNNRLPTCNPIQCPRIGNIEHGNAIHYRNGAIIQRGLGSQVVVTCYDGYRREGSRRRQCTASGSWDGHLQRCDSGESTCKNPGTPLSGTKHGTAYNTGDTVTFSCHYNTVLFGDIKRTCMHTGEWTGFEVKCTGPHEYPTQEELTWRIEHFVGELSRKTKDSRQLKDKVNNLKGKQVYLGRQNMETVNTAGRASISELLNTGGLDVYFLLDVSGSIHKDEKEKGIDVIKGLAKQLGTSGHHANGRTRIGVVAYNSHIWKQAAPGDLGTLDQLLNTMDMWKDALQGDSGTAPAYAFKRINTLIKTTASAQKRTIAIIVISDGLMNEGPDPVEELNKIKKYLYDERRELHIYCIGVGDIDQKSLKQLASDGPEYMLIARTWIAYNLVNQLLYGNNKKIDYACGIAGYRAPPINSDKDLEAVKGQWRWMVALYFNKDMEDFNNQNIHQRFTDPKNKLRCGSSLLMDAGSLTGSRWVLTAAHCVYKSYPYKYIVKLDSLLSATTTEDNSLLFDVKRIIYHKKYDKDTFLNDIALLELKEVVPFSRDIRPICLPPQGSLDECAVNTPATMTGWGKWKSTDLHPARILKNLPTRVQPQMVCQEAAANISQLVTPGKSFCAGGETVNKTLMDGCQIDSGGPLVVKQTKSIHDVDVEVWTQFGIVSSGDGCGQAGKYGIYTQVSAYTDWIQSRGELPDVAG